MSIRSRNFTVVGEFKPFGLIVEALDGKPPFESSVNQNYNYFIFFSLFTQTPNPTYISSILTSTQKLLKFPTLSTSLFAFKFFISSLSLQLSSSKIGKFSSSFSFYSPPQTLVSLTEALTSFSPIQKLDDRIALGEVGKLPKCHLVAEAGREVMLRYAWEDGADDVRGNVVDCSFVKRNLILVFSPAFESIKFVAHFVGIEGDELVNDNVFCERFVEKFGGLRDEFVSRDIHLSWISVNYDGNVEKDNSQGAFFADRVLEMLKMEKREFIPENPIWQLLLVFLYRGSYSALVTVLNKDGVS